MSTAAGGSRISIGSGRTTTEAAHTQDNPFKFANQTTLFPPLRPSALWVLQTFELFWMYSKSLCRGTALGTMTVLNRAREYVNSLQCISTRTLRTMVWLFPFAVFTVQRYSQY